MKRRKHNNAYLKSSFLCNKFAAREERSVRSLFVARQDSAWVIVNGNLFRSFAFFIRETGEKFEKN